jgi:hypothetical protein
MTAVTGTLVLPADAPSVDGVRAVLRVRDITFSDAPEQAPVAEKEMLVDLAPGAWVGFEIDVPQESLDRAGRNECELNLEVHVDRDGDGVFTAGDLVSMQARPIGPDTPGAPLEVPLVTV